MPSTTTPTRIGLVLGAGGYPGWPFTLETLLAVEQYLDVDLRRSEVVVGTSVGSMVGLLLRAGFSVQDMVAHLRGGAMSDEGDHLLHRVLEPAGSLPPALPAWRLPRPVLPSAPAMWWALGGQGRMGRHRLPSAASMLAPRGRSDHGIFGRAADSLLPAWPERDTWITALRARDGRRRVFGREDAATPGEAVTASSAIPGYFKPVAVGGEAHVDAGVLSTTHADLLADRDDLDLVVVVPPLAAADPWTATVDAPLRWLVNAQVSDEVALLRDRGHAVAVLAPPAPVSRAMQGDPVRMSPARVERAATATRTWARAGVGHAVHDAIERRVHALPRPRPARDDVETRDTA